MVNIDLSKYSAADWNRLHVALERQEHYPRWDRIITYSLMFIGMVAFWVAFFWFVAIPILDVWGG